MAEAKQLTRPDWQAPRIDLSGRRLVWHDEFDGDTLDDSKWKCIVWPETPKCDVTCNVYAADMVSVHDGCVWLRCAFRKDGPYGPGFYSGWISTENSLCTTYGYYEIRCRVPKAEGMHAAFWTYANEKPYAGCGRDGTEIDIFETARYRVDSTDAEANSSYAITIHTGDEAGQLMSYGCPDVATLDPAGHHLYDGFHTFGLEWTPTAYHFYYDGLEVQCIDFSGGSVGRFVGTCSRPEFIYLSTHVGSRIASDGHIIADWNGNAFKNPAGTFPADFVIDYLRYYAPKDA